MTEDNTQLEPTLDRVIRNGAVALGHPVLEEFRRGYFLAVMDIAASTGHEAQAERADMLAPLNHPDIMARYVELTGDTSHGDGSEPSARADD